jgi:SEC-C motif-containing protein
MNCPCCSGQTFDRCCGRFISHCALPENATLLMRSRYSAFVLEDRDYLLETWHPDFRPAQLQLDGGIRWLGLEIIASEGHGEKSLVEFEASLLAMGEVSALHERSDFVLQQGRWLYTSGEQLAPRTAPWKPARNQDCPCGSGLKFKRCCASLRPV